MQSEVFHFRLPPPPPPSLPLYHRYDGLLVKRPFNGAWDKYAAEVDDARSRIGFAGQALVVQGPPSSISEAADTLVATAALPAPLSTQIREDACALGETWGKLCPEVKQTNASPSTGIRTGPCSSPHATSRYR